MVKTVANLLLRARVWMDQKGSPAIETAALITFIGLLIITKAGSVGSAVEGAFDAVVTGVSDGL